MKAPIPEECGEWSHIKRIVCAEKGRKITFLNTREREVVKYQIDGCRKLRASLNNHLSKLCDYLVVIASLRQEHCVELKGKNVKHAFEQLESTILQLGLKGANGRLFCWIITRESPSTQSKLQVLKQKFEKRHQARVGIRTSQCEHLLNGA